MPPNRPSPATGPNPGTVVTKAALRAASQPEMTNRAFANVVGLSEATISPAARPSSTGGAPRCQPVEGHARANLVWARHLQGLHILLPDDKAADAWVRQPNAATLFGGRSALERMLSGQVADLFVVRQYLDAQRGGWG